MALIHKCFSVSPLHGAFDYVVNNRNRFVLTVLVNCFPKKEETEKASSVHHSTFPAQVFKRDST